MKETTCVYCAEPLPPEGVERCPACGESTKPRAADLGPKRPLGPKVIALFSLLFGGFGLMGPVFMIVMYTVFPADPNDPIRSLFDQNELFRGWLYASQAIGFVVAACQLTSGIGLLGWREWGRRLGVRVAVSQLVLLVISSVVTAGVCAEALLGSSASGGPAALVQGMALGGAIMGACFGAILPVATFLVLRRPDTREAFAQAEQERSAK